MELGKMFDQIVFISIIEPLFCNVSQVKVLDEAEQSIPGE